MVGESMTSAIINPRFRITIPKQLRQKTGLKIGDKIAFLNKGEEIIMIKVPQKPLTSMAQSLSTEKNVRHLLKTLKEEDKKSEEQ
jgi:AbrB family looped-hinge helix DNA binding protein